MTIRSRRWSTMLVVAALALVTLPPRRGAAEGRRVLFVASSSTPFSARVRAEIEAMGFTIEPAAVLAEREPTTAVAAARVIEGPVRRVELWIADASTGTLVLRAFVMPSPGDDDATETVRASEQLRAFFQPLRAPTPPPSAPPAPPPVQPSPPASSPPAAPPPAAVAAPDRADAPPPSALPSPSTASTAPGPRFVVGADLAVPFQPGGPGFNLGLRGRWMAAPVLGVGAFASVPLVGSTLKAAEGSASVSATLFGADLTVVADPATWVRLSASAGLGLAWVRTSGFASAPYHGQASNLVAGLAILGAEVAPRLTARTHLCLDGHLGFSLPRVDIAFAGRQIAVWGRPLGVLSAGVSVDL